MATERPTFSRTQRLASLFALGFRKHSIVRRAGQFLPMAFFAFVLVFNPLGNPAHQALAASARPQDSCPTSYSNGGAACSGAITQIIPGTLQPPGGSIFPWNSWWACVSTQQLITWIYANDGPNAWRIWDIVDDIDNNLWDGNWDILVDVLPTGQVIWGGYNPHGVTQQQVWDPNAPASWPNPRPPCPPPQPPCLTCAPQIQVTYFNFWAYAPKAVVSGYADCSASTPAGSWCPPSVGNAVHLWVSGFTSSQGPRGACSNLGDFGGLYPGGYTVCMRWVQSQRVGALAWDFNDEHIDPTSGQGQRVSGMNYNVDTDVNQQLAHTFEYSSAFDPIRQCVRPCQGDLSGPPMAGYPNGTPAFQVQVASNWSLQFLQCLNGCGAWQTIDLRQFGSPTPWFTSVTTTPLFVLSYGSVTP